MSDVPEPEVQAAHRSLLDRVSIVWLVPIGALVISLALAWQNYASRGPLIEIAFTDAEGVRAGETELRYRDVPVGLVEDVSFSEGLSSVVVEVRLDQNIAPYVDEGSEFWVVRPQVTAQGVTGLSTVLSGVFIQGSWDTEAGEATRSFRGRALAPVARPDVPGLQIALTSRTGEGLLQGTPILYRGVQIGAIAGIRLDDSGDAVVADAFVEAPYDRLVSTSTRFWNASGFDFSLGPAGATLDVSSLAALVSGGVAMENLVSGGEPVSRGATFQLHDDEEEALSSVFADPVGSGRVSVGLVFSGNVSGLTAGSPVEYRGLRVGAVSGVTGYIDEARFGDRRVRLLATAALDPASLGVDAEAPDGAALEVLAELVERGVRARLARGSLFSGGLKIVLAEIEEAAAAEIDRDAEPHPLFPTIAGDLPQASETVEDLIVRFNDLPIEGVLDGITALLRNVNVVVASDEVRATPGELLALVGDVRALVGSDEVREVPGEIATLLADLQSAVDDVRAVLTEFRDAGAATALTEVLAQAGPAVETLNRVLAAAEPAAADLPRLVDRLAAAADDVASTAAEVADLPLGDLVAEAEATLAAARTLAASDALRALPQEIGDTLDEATAALAQIREAELASRTADTIDSVGTAAFLLGEAAEGLPALVARIDAVAGSIEALPLRSAVAAAEQSLLSANRLLNADGTESIPVELNAALAELREVLADVRSAGLIAQAETALSEAGDAAAAVRAATSGVPDAVAGFTELTRTANALPLERLATEVAGLAAAAERLLQADGAEALPASLNATLSEVQAALAELRRGGLVASANQTLASARDAAAAFEASTADLPDLAVRLDRLARQAERTLAGYDEGSELTREAQSTLRDVQSAARAVSSLARQIERNPNSLLLGR